VAAVVKERSPGWEQQLHVGHVMVVTVDVVVLVLVVLVAVLVVMAVLAGAQRNFVTLAERVRLPN
jgi:hypothetical protein